MTPLLQPDKYAKKPSEGQVIKPDKIYLADYQVYTLVEHRLPKSAYLSSTNGKDNFG
jgi:hypothetical protein